MYAVMEVALLPDFIEECLYKFIDVSANRDIWASTVRLKQLDKKHVQVILARRVELVFLVEQVSSVNVQIKQQVIGKFLLLCKLIS